MSTLSKLKQMVATPPPAPDHYTPLEGMLEKETYKVTDFPMDVLPEKHRSIVSDLYTYLAYPPGFTATGMLAAASIACGRTHTIHNGIWEDGACLYLAIVAPPGTMKSHPLKFALGPCIEKNKRAIKQYIREKNELAADGSSNEPRKDEQFLYSDFTIETLTRAIRKNSRGVAVYIDELKAWFANFNRYNSGSEQEFWLMNWTGAPYAMNRASYKAVIDKTFIPVVGTIQPGLLEDIGKGGRALSGFIERILFCYPDSVPVEPFKRRRDRSLDVYSQIMARYTPLVTSIMDWSRLPGGNDEDEVDQSYLCVLEEAAEDRLIEYMNDLKKRMDAIDNEYVRNIFSKMQNYCTRFTMLLYLMHEASGEITHRSKNGGEVRINMEIVLKAITITEYFLGHSLKAQSAINAATPLDRLPKNIRKWYADLPTGTALTTLDIERAAMRHGLSRSQMFIYLGEADPKKRIFLREKHGIYTKLYHR